MGRHGQTNPSNAQMEQVKTLVKDHLDKNRFFEHLRTAVAKDPKLADLDRNAVIEKLK